MCWGPGCWRYLLFWGRLELWHLSVVSLALGASWALDWPTRRSMVPDLVGKARTVDAMVLENVIQGFTRIAGPLAAGYVTAAYGSLGALLVLVGLGTLALVLLSGLKTDSRAPSPGTWAAGWAGRQGVGQYAGICADIRRFSHHDLYERLGFSLHEPVAGFRTRRIRPRPRSYGVVGCG